MGDRQRFSGMESTASHWATEITTLDLITNDLFFNYCSSRLTDPQTAHYRKMPLLYHYHATGIAWLRLAKLFCTVCTVELPDPPYLPYPTQRTSPP
jgi:hypothetical protein